MQENYKLYQGDCLEVMDNLSILGLEFDAIITDPPYNISKKITLTLWVGLE